MPKEENNHTMVSNKEGFCNDCGKKLVKRLWEDKVKYDFETGGPYQVYAFICPELLTPQTN